MYHFELRDKCFQLKFVLMSLLLTQKLKNASTSFHYKCLKIRFWLIGLRKSFSKYTIKCYSCVAHLIYSIFRGNGVDKTYQFQFGKFFVSTNCLVYCFIAFN